MASSDSVLRAKLRVPRVKALARERPLGLLVPLWERRLGLVVAPAGSGKTTLVAQFAVASQVPVAWYRAEPGDSSAAAAVAHLERSFVDSLGVEGGWADVDDALVALDRWEGGRALVVVDDLHTLWGTEAEAVLERLLDHLPPALSVLVASRRMPAFNLSRLRVAGDLVEVGADELRFRSWEVERLFHEFYGEPLPPDELADLARRTGGWAAGLQLFHLATAGKPASERRRVLRQLSTRSKLVSEYLSRNVLDELPLHVRDFLVQTCVLGRLEGALCDELTGATSGAALLAELEQRQIFTASLDGDGSYRYHEVLRTHLETVLVETLGHAGARARYRRAGRLLESHGHLHEALRAYARADDWEAATALLVGSGETVVDRPGAWVEFLPPALLDHDPWLLLARARRHLALGQWAPAAEAYARAEAASGPGQAAASSRRERVALEAWFRPAVRVPDDWTGVLRLAVVRDPVGVVARWATRSASGATGLFAEGLAALLAGDVTLAAGRLATVASSAEVSRPIALGAGLAAAMARWLAGEPVAGALERICEEADEAGLPWLSALASIVAERDAARTGDANPGADPAISKDDPWGLALDRLWSGLASLRAGTNAAGPLREAAEGFADLGAPVPEAWALAGVALSMAVTGDSGAPAACRRASLAARAAETAGASVLVAAALSLLEPVPPGRALDGRPPPGTALAVRVFLPVLAWRRVDVAAPVPVHAGPTDVAPLVVRCFGSLSVEVAGIGLDTGLIKPRVRSLLRILAVHGGRAVHRDRLVEWLWPAEGDLRVGTRNLQVAVSALRQFIEPGVARGAARFVVREGDTYRLDVPPEAIDVAHFDVHLAAADRLQRAADFTAAAAALGHALDLYCGELLADEKAAEWVLSDRDRYRLLAANASQTRAELLVDAGETTAALREADRGLGIDRYRDALWRLVVAAHTDAGERAAAWRAEERYAAVLRELGLDSRPLSSSS